MCDFKSAIVLRDKTLKGGFKLLMSPWTEHHSDLEAMFKLRENVRLNYAKVEFKPTDMSVAYQPESYKLRIDEDRVPDWFDGDMKVAVADKMRAYIKSIIVTGDVCLLIGGQFIVAPGAKVECAKAMVITANFGTVQAVKSGGTVQSVESGGTVQAVWSGGTVQAVWSGGTVQAVWSGALINGKKKK